MTMDESREQNLKNWESRVDVHAGSKMYDLDGMVVGRQAVQRRLRVRRGATRRRHRTRRVHLQCHIGTDTVSLARLGGARHRSRLLAGRAGGRARSRGAVRRRRRASSSRSSTARSTRWAASSSTSCTRASARSAGCPTSRAGRASSPTLLRPGGRLYLREGHPVLWALDPERDRPAARGGLSVLRDGGAGTSSTFAGTYTDGDASASSTVSHEWNHGLGEIVQAVLDAGLTLTRLVEHDFAEWKALDWMEVDDKGHWRLPDHRERLPADVHARSPQVECFVLTSRPDSIFLKHRRSVRPGQRLTRW